MIHMDHLVVVLAAYNLIRLKRRGAEINSGRLHAANVSVTEAVYQESRRK